LTQNQEIYQKYRKTQLYWRVFIYVLNTRSRMDDLLQVHNTVYEDSIMGQPCLPEYKVRFYRKVQCLNGARAVFSCTRVWSSEMDHVEPNDGGTTPFVLRSTRGPPYI